MRLPHVQIPYDEIAEFCKKWHIAEFALFGSVLREDFRADSDIDVLVTFSPDAQHSLLDRVIMQDELSSVLGRKVDLISKRGIARSRNPLRRKAILNSAQVVYVTRS